MNTQSKIKQLLLGRKVLRVNELSEFTGVSKQMIHRAILALIDAGEVEKLGKAPKTFYQLKQTYASEPAIQYNAIEKPNEDFLSKHFLLITETGKRLEGIEAMRFWCARQKLPLEKTINEFIQTRKKYLDHFGSTRLIDGTEKIKNTKAFTEIGVDKLFYIDFYAIERFGKTKLGTLLHYAKQGQNKKLMQEICESTLPTINALIKKEKIDAVAYIPPSIKRSLQIMKVFQQSFNVPLPHLNIMKVSGDIIVPQKALSKIEDRIANARASLQPLEKRTFDHVLIIDDAVGSGASMNETAIKLKASKIAKKITGLAIVGSYKGFEVIQEV